MCLLSGVWKLSMELLVSQNCTYTLCSMHIKTWTYKLQVWFDPWFNLSVLMSCAMPSLHTIAKPQLGKVIIERKYVSLYSMGFYLKLHGHLTIELKTWICSCFKFSHKTLLFGFLLVIITSLCLYFSLSYTHTCQQPPLFWFSTYCLCFKIFNSSVYLFSNEFLNCLGIKVYHSFFPVFAFLLSIFSITILHFYFLC